MKNQQWLAPLSAAAAAVLLLCSCSAGQSSIDSGKDPGYQPPSYDSNGEVALPDIPDGETYLQIVENPEKSAAEAPTVTFSLKVDTASYANVTRYLESGELPPKDAVRTEELLNYFRYEEEMSFSEGSPFALYTEVGPSPFHPDKHIAMVRVKAPEIPQEELPPCNLTFLIDTSGSMDSYDKLPLLKNAFSLLVETLSEDDRVSIVTYAGSSAVVLDGVSGADKTAILDAIHNLTASGSTAGAKGIQTCLLYTSPSPRDS